jgi:hypothetical protein
LPATAIIRGPHKLIVVTDVAAVMKRRIKSGEPFDLAVLVNFQTNELIKTGKLISGGAAIAFQAGARFETPFDYPNLAPRPGPEVSGMCRFFQYPPKQDGTLGGSAMAVANAPTGAKLTAA